MNFKNFGLESHTHSMRTRHLISQWEEFVCGRSLISQVCMWTITVFIGTVATFVDNVLMKKSTNTALHYIWYLVSAIGIVNPGVVSPTLNVNLTVFEKKNMGIMSSQCCKYCHFLSDFSSKFQSSITIFHHKFVWLQIMPNCIFNTRHLDELKGCLASHYL